MKPQRLLLLLLLLTTIAACTKTPASSENQKTPTSDTSKTKQVATSGQTNNMVHTEPLSPQPIRVALSNLPKPYLTDSASKSPQVVPIPQNPTLRVPPGFTVNVYADGLDQPRWLALTPTGDVLVTETNQNRITLLHDTRGNGVADVHKTFATSQNGLDIPFGMAFADGYFFLGNTNSVLRFSYNRGQQQLTGTGQKITDLTPGGYHQHWTRNVVISPDGKKLYASIGSRSNDDADPLPRASVQVMNLDGANRQTFAFGLRNPVGLAFQPITGELYTTVNERDGLGDDLVPDYLTRIRQGEFYGWPYTYLAPDNIDPRHIKDGKSQRPDLASRTKTPDVLFQSHSAALGLQFYKGNTFPEKYRHGGGAIGLYYLS